MYVESVGVPNAGIPATGTKMVSATSSNTKIVENADGESQNSKINSEPAKPAAVVFDTNNDKRVSEEKKLPDSEKIRKTIESFSAQLTNSEIKFGIHDRTNRVTIKIVDKGTDKVIKEIPPEKTLDMIAKCMEIAGVLVDERL